MLRSHQCSKAVLSCLFHILHSPNSKQDRAKAPNQDPHSSGGGGGGGGGAGAMGVVSGAISYAKEMSIRRRIASIYNKREDDFASLKEYNDYLEEVEDMTVNLIEGRDVALIEAEIARYEKENFDQITVSRARKAEELTAALEASKAPVKTDVDMAEQSSQTAGVSVKAQGQYAPATIQAGPAGMAPQPVPVGVPNDYLHTYTDDDEETMKLRAERGARAGGWTIGLSKKRAFEEAFSCLWV